MQLTPPESQGGRILPEDACLVRFVEPGPEAPVAAGGAGTPLGIVPAAAQAKAGDGFRLKLYRAGRCARLAFALPAITTGAAFAVDGLNQQVLALRQAAMLGLADTSTPPSLTQPLMPVLTL